MPETYPTPEEKELTPEEAEETLDTLEARFRENLQLHEGIEWKDVEASLKDSPEALWSVAQMEAQGHSPDVYHDDDKSYYIGTCSIESPESARNCVYDKKAADRLKQVYPDAVFNGSAVEMAEAMGIELMSPEHYENILQKKGRFDDKTESWLLTHSNSEVRLRKAAFAGSCRGIIMYTDAGRSRYMGWRGSLRVKKVSA